MCVRVCVCLREHYDNDWRRKRRSGSSSEKLSCENYRACMHARPPLFAHIIFGHCLCPSAVCSAVYPANILSPDIYVNLLVPPRCVRCACLLPFTVPEQFVRAPRSGDAHVEWHAFVSPEARLWIQMCVWGQRATRSVVMARTTRQGNGKR